MSDEGAKLIKEGIVESKNANFITATITDKKVKIYPLIIKDNLTILELNNILLIKSNIKIILDYVEGNMIIEKLELSTYIYLK